MGRKKDAPDFATEMREGYGFEGEIVPLGRPFLEEDAPLTDIEVGIPFSLLNRHGLIAGATGTGKTKTLQLMAEAISDAGVPVFAADMKGDVAGLAAPGELSEPVAERRDGLKTAWEASAFPIEPLVLDESDRGVPVRASVAGFGPVLLSKVLDLNETQESSLSLLFRFCEDNALPLIELEDLRAALAWLVGPGKEELGNIGGVSKATVGVIQRKVSQLEAEGGDVFFGEPEFSVGDFLRLTPDGRGVISLLDLEGVAQNAALFSTFLMWLLGELFEELPEVGDADKPKLVFFFDEAHLLFKDASDNFLDAVAQTVRLIRSKGVGVYFVTQLPTDLSDEVLSQLGHRVQHAVRAFTKRDVRALKAAVDTFPITEHYELDETLQSLGVGEAAITALNPKGVPTPVAATRIYPPRSRMDTISDAERATLVDASELMAKYGERVDRESAEEILTARLEGDRARAQEEAERAARDKEIERIAKAEKSSRKKTSRKRKSRSDDDLAGQVGDYLSSRSGKRLQRQVMRSVLGMLRR